MLVSSFVVEWQQVIKFKHLNVVFTFLHAIKYITNHHLDLFSLFLVFHLVKNSKAIGGIRGTVSIDAFIQIALAATTKDNSTALNWLGCFWISSTVSMRIVTNIEISISSHIAVTVLYNKLDQQWHQYLQLTQYI
jgi:hypothetical protein